ncbi:MAG: hypothetical protein ACPGEG_00295 [Salibacteraceae bacterium]
MRLLVLSLLFFIQFGAYADCDLFKEEVKIISEDIKDMYKDLYESSEFVDVASESKTDIDNEKLGRLLSETKSKLDRIEHGMSQLKLHQDCACPDFKFQFVDNLLIEIKFWLKKGSEIDIAKPKKTNYAAIKSNTQKALSKATDLQIYFIDPCKEKQTADEIIPEAPIAKTEEPIDTVNTVAKTEKVVVEAKKDTTSITPEEKTEVSEPVDVPNVITATNTQNETDSVTAKTETVISKPKEEKEIPNEQALAETNTVTEESPQEELTSSDNNSTENTEKTVVENNSEPNIGAAASESGSSAGGVAVGATVAGVGVVAAVVSSDNKEKNQNQPVSEPEDAQNIATEDNPETNEKVVESAPEEIVEEELVASQKAGINDDTEPEPNPTTSTSDAIATEPVESVSVEAVATGASVAAAIVASDGKEEDEEIKNEIEEPTTEEEKVVEPMVISEPEIEEKEEVTVEPIPAVEKEEKEQPAPAAAVSNNFHYAVQIATGNANTSEGKYAALEENIYVVQEGGMNKYRIGKYTNINDAVNTKKKAFNGGFLDAFVVAYNNGERISIPAAKAIEKGETPPSQSANPAPKMASKKAEKTSKIKRNAEVVLAIQIGASITSTDPVYELVKYERKIGMEVHVLQGSPVRFYTSPTKDQNTIEQTLGKVKSAGIDEAFLIGVANGKRIDYQEALDFLGNN